MGEHGQGFGGNVVRWARHACGTLAVAALVAGLAACSSSPAQAIGRTVYVSDCRPGAAKDCVQGDDANPGNTEARPKQTLAGVNINSLPAGSKVLLARGGVWVQRSMLVIENPNARPDEPITIDAYGSGPLPWIQAPEQKNAAIAFGMWNNTSDDGGYTLRNFKLDGQGSSAMGLFLIHNLRNLTIENTEITGFHIGIHSQGRAPHGVHHLVIRNNNISRNSGMGILGQFSDTLIEGNTFEANNVRGSGFEHGTYLSGNADSGRNIVIRNNRYLRNSVVNGVCSGGNMTFHGQMDGVLIENNLIEQDKAEPGCWAMSITQGYKTAEWFRNFVVRNNRIVNAGNTAINAQSAPGILVEGNVIVNRQPTYQTAISVGHTDYPDGDVPDGNATVRNNTACFTQPKSGSSVVVMRAPNSQQSNNVMLTGAQAASGVCAR
jgi:hypothetical protein